MIQLAPYSFLELTARRICCAFDRRKGVRTPSLPKKNLDISKATLVKLNIEKSQIKLLLIITK